MKRSLLAAIALLGAVPNLRSQERPNIVFILADDLGFSDIGCYGSEIDTPNLDRLARDGVRFSTFYNTGRCCPSRAALMTGLYPHDADIGHMASDLGVRGYRDRLNPDAVTMPELLRSAGYRTMMSGKWHLGWRDEGSPTARGFDRFYGTRGYIDSYYTVIPRTEVWLDDRMVLKAGEPAVNHLHPDREWYTTDVFTDYALHFIDEARDEPERPFFLYLAYNAPHFPLHAKPEDIEKYRGRYRGGFEKHRTARLARLIELGLLPRSTELSALDAKAWNELTEEQRDDLDFKMALFAAIVDRLDQNIGRLLQHLEQAELLDNTLIVFQSDNGGTKETGLFGIRGEQNTVRNYRQWARQGGWTSSYGRGWANLSNAPFRRFKRESHEGGTRSPCIVHWPARLRSHAGAIRRQVGHIIDWLPTFADVASAQIPSERNGRAVPQPPGQSLLEFFAGEHTTPRTLFWEHEGNRAIRIESFKLVGRRAQPWELYDLAADPTEQTNLAADQPERAAALKRRWDEWAAASHVLPTRRVEALRKQRREAQKKARAGKKD